MATSTTAKKPAAKKTPVTSKSAAVATTKKVTAKVATTKTATAKKPTTPVAKAAPKSAVAKKAAPARKASSAPSAEERYRMVQEAAYYIAEKNGFAGGDMSYWIEAEAQINRLLSGK